MARELCPVCHEREASRSVCRECGRAVCHDCKGRGRECLNCTARALEGTLCAWRSCGEPVVLFTWRRLSDGARQVPRGYCVEHARRPSIVDRYSLKLVHRRQPVDRVDVEPQEDPDA